MNNILLLFQKMKLTAFTIIILCIKICQNSILKRVLLTNPAAVCLDGSPGAYYIHRGTNPKKIFLYFQAGGWCGLTSLDSTLESCYQRTKNHRGSSNSYPEEIKYSQQGIFKDNISYFGEATKVFLRYCDGAGHQGYRAEPLDYKGTKLYFRGHNITQAQLTDLERSEGLFSRANTIIVSGSSAGGLATFLWSNYIKQRAQATHIFAISDSGIFLDAPEFYSGEHMYLESFKTLFSISNTEISPPVPECARDYPLQPYRCMLAEQLYKYLKVPIFVIQSLYDSYSIPNILGINCVVDELTLSSCPQGQRAHIEQYRQNISKLIKQIGTYNPQNGYWAPSCVFHGIQFVDEYQSPQYRIPMNSNNSIHSSVLNWIQQKQVLHYYIDEGSWPSNQPCSRVQMQFKEQSIIWKYLLISLVIFVLIVVVFVVRACGFRRYKNNDLVEEDISSNEKQIKQPPQIQIQTNAGVGEQNIQKGQLN